MSEGRLASITLKAEKNTTSAASSSMRLPAPRASMIWLTTSTATALTNTPFMRRYFSATMIAGTITAIETTQHRQIDHPIVAALEMSSVPRNRPGTSRKLAVSMACSAKMPISSRSSSLLRSTEPIKPGTVSASRWKLSRRGLGTTNCVIAMPTAASATISQKMPATPMKCAAIGPATSATMKEAPMVMPTMAMALVRFSSAVRSATMREDHRADGAGALQRAADDDAADGRRARRDRAADRRTGSGRTRS